MASTVEGRGQESVDNLNSNLRVDESCGEYQNVGVVVCAGQASEFRCPAYSCADALVLVESHGYAVAASAHCDSRIALAALHGLSAWMGKVGVVAAIGRIGTEVVILQTLVAQMLHYNVFKFETGVVTADCNLLGC